MNGHERTGQKDSYFKDLPMTSPTLRWVTEPHLYFGVDIDDFTRTRSPTRTLIGAVSLKAEASP